MSLDKKHAAAGISGDKKSSESPTQDCENNDFEVEFLHCTNKADFDSAQAKIKAIPEGKCIKAQEPTLILTTEKEHYLNLTREDKWLDDKITHLDRTTQKPRIVVRFKKKESRAVKVEIFDPSGANLQYTDGEKGRNDNFKEKLIKEGTTDGNGVLIIEDLQLSAAGGNKYKVKATDLKTTQVKESSGTLVTWRYLWVQQIQAGKDSWKPTADPLASLKNMVTEYKNCFIKVDIDTLKKEEIYGQEFVEFNDTSTVQEVKNKLNTLPEVKKRMPFVTTAVMVRTMGDILSTKHVERGITVRDYAVCHNSVFYPKYLIAAYKKYDSPTNKYIDVGCIEGASFAGKSISTDLIQVLGMHGENATSTNNPYFIGAYFSVDISKLPPGTGDLIISYKAIIKTWAGRNWDGICHSVAEIPSLSPAGVKNVLDYTTMASIVMTHELGHWVGMVANGTAELPDKPKDFYTGAQPSDPILNGHRGPHCKNGYTAGINRGKCVMFGAAGVPDFCSDCKACVLKVDCSASTLEAK